mgnify:CR=1 FL=1
MAAYRHKLSYYPVFPVQRFRQLVRHHAADHHHLRRIGIRTIESLSFDYRHFHQGHIIGIRLVKVVEVDDRFIRSRTVSHIAGATVDWQVGARRHSFHFGQLGQFMKFTRF